MTVYKTHDNKLKVCLTDTEVLTSFGTYERLHNINLHTKIIINALLRDIISQHKSLLKGGKITTKITAHKNRGCEFTLYSNKTSDKDYTLFFSDSENLTLAILQLYKYYKHKKAKSSLFKMANGYALIIQSQNEKSFLKIKHFFETMSDSPVSAEYTREYGISIITGNAVERYGKAFLK